MKPKWLYSGLFAQLLHEMLALPNWFNVMLLNLDVQVAGCPMPSFEPIDSIAVFETPRLLTMINPSSTIQSRFLPTNIRRGSLS